MNGAHYLLQVNIYLIVFYGFYRLLLDRETYFHFNRMYLIAAACFSFLIPFIQLDWFSAQPVSQHISVSVSQLYMVAGISDNANSGLTLGSAIALLYVIGTSVFLIRLAYQLVSIRKLMQGELSGAAFSFFNKLSIDKQLPEQAIINKHEQIHMRQLHSLDVVFFEVVAAVNWFNPIVYLYKQSVKNIHEYLADEEAAQFQGDKQQYALLLLSTAFGVNPSTLTNSFFNKSLIKKRITMLHKQKSKRTAILKYGLFVPLFGLTLILSSATIRKNRTIRIAAESIPLDQPLKVVEAALPQLKVTKQAIKPSVTLRGDTLNPRWVGFYAYLALKLKYPKAAEEALQQGNSQVAISIKDGAIQGLEAHTKLGFGCDEQVMQTILAFQDFRQIKDGKYLLNVTFKMEGSKTPMQNANLAPAPGFTTLNTIVVTGYPSDATTAVTAATKQDKVYDFVAVDTPPSFPGGISQFYSFIGKTIKYPEEAAKNKVQGKVFVSFIVEMDGSLNEIHVDRRLGSGTDEEALRVLSLSPRWNPGIKDKQPIRVKYNIPISFALSAPAKSPGKSENPSVEITKVNITKVNNTKETIYYIDGVETNEAGLKKLNTKEIASMNVIKASTKPEVAGRVFNEDVIIIKTKNSKAAAIDPR
jgi:TonB family protein